MKKHLINTAIAMTLTTSSLTYAKQTDSYSDKVEAQAIYKQPTVIGFGSGIVVGAIVAGPVGAAVAGTIGLLIGNAEEVDAEHKITQQTLQKNQQALNSVTSQKQQLIQQLALIEQHNNQLNQELNVINTTLALASNLEKLKLNLQFNVNSSELESFYQEQVSHLAELIKTTPALRIHLSGFSDRNGDAEKNLVLSQQRVQTVKALLIKHGIHENNIITQALGENAPVLAQQNLQNDFYDRRVEIQLVQPQLSQVKSTHINENTHLNDSTPLSESTPLNDDTASITSGY